MTDAPEERLGEKTSMYCSVCEQERTFVWAKWRDVEFFGYPPKQEYGWECSACGSKFCVSEPADRAILSPNFRQTKRTLPNLDDLLRTLE